MRRIVLTIAAFLLAACGGGGGSPGSNAVSAPPPPPPPPPTSLGVDGDANGVWDDVDAFIGQAHASSEKTQRGLEELSKALQFAIDNPSAPTGAADAAAIRDAIDCLFFIDGEAGGLSAKELLAVVLATQERTDAYLQFDNRFRGSTLSGNTGDLKLACSFDPDALPN